MVISYRYRKFSTFFFTMSFCMCACTCVCMFVVCVCGCRKNSVPIQILLQRKMILECLIFFLVCYESSLFNVMKMIQAMLYLTVLAQHPSFWRLTGTTTTVKSVQFFLNFTLTVSLYTLCACAHIFCMLVCIRSMRLMNRRFFDIITQQRYRAVDYRLMLLCVRVHAYHSIFAYIFPSKINPIDGFMMHRHQT